VEGGGTYAVAGKKIFVDQGCQRVDSSAYSNLIAVLDALRKRM
jgi:hypothetical protein